MFRGNRRQLHMPYTCCNTVVNISALDETGVSMRLCELGIDYWDFCEHIQGEKGTDFLLRKKGIITDPVAWSKMRTYK